MSASAEADLIALIAADAGVIALGAAKVYLNAADEGTLAPYVVVTGTHDPIYALDNSLQADHVTFTVAAWGDTADQAERVADAIQAVIDNADPQLELLVIGRTGGFDQETTMDAAVLTIDRWL